MTFKCDLDLQPTSTIVSNELLCQIILKSTHKCRIYGPDKLNLWSFYHSTLTFNPPQQMIQMNNYAKLFWNPCITVEEAQFMTIL